MLYPELASTPAVPRVTTSLSVRVQAVDGCLVAVHVSLQTQQRTRRCLLLDDDDLINAVQLRAVTGDRCRQRFARRHLRQVALNNRDSGVLHSPRHAVHRHADIIDTLTQCGIGRRHCLLKLAHLARHKAGLF